MAMTMTMFFFYVCVVIVARSFLAPFVYHAISDNFVDVPLHCPALPLYPRRTNGSALVDIANAHAQQLPRPPKPGRLVSPVFYVVHHAMGHLRQPTGP